MSVVRLPTAAESFVRARKGRGEWLIEIITPCGNSKPLKTTIERWSNAETAIQRGREIARVRQRPFKIMKGGAA